MVIEEFVSTIKFDMFIMWPVLHTKHSFHIKHLKLARHLVHQVARFWWPKYNLASPKRAHSWLDWIWYMIMLVALISEIYQINSTKWLYVDEHIRKPEFNFFIFFICYQLIKICYIWKSLILPAGTLFNRFFGILGTDHGTYIVYIDNCRPCTNCVMVIYKPG